MKGRKTRATGGVNAAAEDLATRPMEYTKDSNVNREALQRKRGGGVREYEGVPAKAAKMIGKISGDKSKMHAGRKPRKSGGRLKIADWSAAQSGTPAKGRTTDGNLS